MLSGMSSHPCELMPAKAWLQTPSGKERDGVGKGSGAAR